MKKVIVCLLAAFAANCLFAGKAWYSEKINAMLAKLPAKYYSKCDATLWGFFSNNIWIPPYATYDYVTGSFIVDNANSFKVTSLATLNNCGGYDVGASIDNFFEKCGTYITDEFGQEYTTYDESIAAFYEEYERMNYAEAEKNFVALESAYTLWSSDIKNQTTEVGVDVSGIAEKAKEVDQLLDDAKKEVASTVESTKRVSEDLNNKLSEVKENLAKISEEAVYEAQKKIESTVTDFNSFVNKLETAIELEGWDDTAFESAFDELTKSEQDLVDAITQLQKSSGNAEAQQAITILGGQLTGIRSLKSSLRTAITNKDKSAASGVLSSARGMSFYNSRKAISKLKNKLKELKSKEKTLNVLVSAALSTMKEQDDFEACIAKLRDSFSTTFITMMDNFHQLNAYLGATNSIAYLDKRSALGNGKASLADFTADELARWINLSMPQKIDDEYSFGACMLGGKTRYFIWDTLASTYGLYAWPYDEDGKHGWQKFMSTYGLTSASPNYNGFYQDLTYPGTTTNWYAKNITAPYNWADGTSIVVTNGVFKAAEKGYCIKITGTEDNEQGEKYVVFGSGPTTNNLTFATAIDSNVKVTVSGDSDAVTVTFGVYYK